MRGPRIARALAAGAALVAALSVAALFVARRSDGPWGMLPGGPFRGASEPCPDTGWTRFEDARESELEAAPDGPRSVRTWNVVVGDRLYVPADFLTPWKRWPFDVERDPRVRLRIDGHVFACQATRVRDERTILALRSAAGRKYDIGPGDLSTRVEVFWFRMDPRSSHRAASPRARAAVPCAGRANRGRPVRGTRRP